MSGESDCAECGIRSFSHRLPAQTSQKELVELVEQLNQDAAVDGILCQLPLPEGLNEDQVIHAIAPDKDVDCFHPFNVGQMSIGAPTFLPCTPAGGPMRSPLQASSAWCWDGAIL